VPELFLRAPAKYAGASTTYGLHHHFECRPVPSAERRRESYRPVPPPAPVVATHTARHPRRDRQRSSSAGADHVRAKLRFTFAPSRRCCRTALQGLHSRSCTYRLDSSWNASNGHRDLAPPPLRIEVVSRERPVPPFFPHRRASAARPRKPPEGDRETPRRPSPYYRPRTSPNRPLGTLVYRPPVPLPKGDGDGHGPPGH